MAKRKKSAKQNSISKSKRSIELHQIAHYAFFAGLLVAIIAGLFDKFIGAEALITTLFILGFIVGLFNLTAKETMPFLIATIALMLAGIVNFGLIPVVGDYIRAILSNIVVFVSPAALILGFKVIWKLASD
ncbi:hypothetical protein COV12_02395 [Candidatus Woesearchaeota archaeon CG10_big_fil_rev_8_21_14_0_10_32_24]|nr:MAG: hypothetical protein COV12_02395 [Candidatus Woesearchaeota archaeon CG10_big_fil_rev_8_21_14_0_10_32_24]